MRKQNPKYQPHAPDLSTLVYGHVPPQDKELEAAILGAIMLESGAIETAEEILKPEAFYVDANMRIYTAMMALRSDNQPIDLLTVVGRLKEMGELEMVGGPHYVSTLTNNVVSSANLDAHCRIVLQDFMRREVIRLTGELLAGAYDPTVDVYDLMDKFDMAGATIVQHNVAGSSQKPLDTILMAAAAKIDAAAKCPTVITGIPSGLPSIDAITKGWQPCELTLGTAQSGDGKTALALNNLAVSAAQAGHPVLLYLLETNGASAGIRMLAGQGINKGVLQSGEIHGIGTYHLDRAMNTLSALSNLITVDNDTTDIKMMCAGIKAWFKRKKQLGKNPLIIIDYNAFITGKPVGMPEQDWNGVVSKALIAVMKQINGHCILYMQQQNEGIKNTSWDKHPGSIALREGAKAFNDCHNMFAMWRATNGEIDNDRELAGRRRLRFFKLREEELQFFNVELFFKGEFQRMEEYTPPPLYGSPPPGGSWKPVEKDY